MKTWIKRYFKRDNNYYCGLLFLTLSSLSLLVWLLTDSYEPIAVLITFLLGFFGFSLLWKSDNDYRFAALNRELCNLHETFRPRHISPAAGLRHRKLR